MGHCETNFTLLKSADLKAKKKERKKMVIHFQSEGPLLGGMQMMGEEIIYKVLLSHWFKEEGNAVLHSPAEAP